MKQIIYLLFLPIAASAQIDTTTQHFIVSTVDKADWQVYLLQGSIGTETLIISDSGVTIQIEKTPLCDFFGKYDPASRKAYYVFGDSCSIDYRFRKDYESDQFAYIFTDRYPKETCPYCICFSAGGHDLVVSPDGLFTFDGRHVLRSFSAYLQLYSFLQN